MSGLVAKKQAQEQEVIRVTGCLPAQVVAVNPTKAELEALGINIKEEPTYKGDKEGVATLRVDFWLSNSKLEYLDGDKMVQVTKPFITKASYWIENKIERSQAGNVQIINDYVQDARSASVEALKDNPNMTKWFQLDGVREAYTGEVQLLKTIFKWLGFSNGNKEKGIPADKLKLSKNISQIITSGDVSELKGLIKSCQENGNGIKFLLGVEEKAGKMYQTVYTSFPMTPATKNYDKLNEALNGEYNKFKGDYQNSFELKLYKVKPNMQADSQVEKKAELKF